MDSATSDYVFGMTADEAAELQVVSPTPGLASKPASAMLKRGPESFFGGNARNPVQVPEPGSLALLGAGLLGIAALVRRRKSKV